MRRRRRREPPRAPPRTAPPPGPENRLPSRAGRGAVRPAAGSRACCRAHDGRPGPAPAAGSTGGQHPPRRPRLRAPRPQRQTRCSQPVPFTEISSQAGQRRNRRALPCFHHHPTPTRGRGRQKKKKKAGLFSLFPFLAPQPTTFNQKNKA